MLTQSFILRMTKTLSRSVTTTVPPCVIKPWQFVSAVRITHSSPIGIAHFIWLDDSLKLNIGLIHTAWNITCPWFLWISLAPRAAAERTKFSDPVEQVIHSSSDVAITCTYLELRIEIKQVIRGGKPNSWFSLRSFSQAFAFHSA